MRSTRWHRCALFVLGTGMLAFGAGCGQPDVFIADTVSDTGAEPNQQGPNWPFWWETPNIWNRTSPGQSPPNAHQSPVLGTNYAHVVLRNRGMGAGTGRVELYARGTNLYSNNLSWPMVGSATALVAQGAQVKLVIPWTASTPGHQCLQARWISGQEQLASPLVADPAVNVLANNNVAQRNMEVVRPPAPVPFTMTAETARAFSGSLVVAAEPDKEGQTFQDGGAILIDLGAELFERWSSVGAKGAGIAVQKGTTLIEVTDPEEASIDGLTLKEGEEAKVTATLTWDKEAKPKAARRLRFMQFEAGAEVPMGGVTYEVLPPEK